MQRIHFFVRLHQNPMLSSCKTEDDVCFHKLKPTDIRPSINQPSVFTFPCSNQFPPNMSGLFIPFHLETCRNAEAGSSQNAASSGLLMEWINITSTAWWSNWSPSLCCLTSVCSLSPVIVRPCSPIEHSSHNAFISSHCSSGFDDLEAFTLVWELRWLLF